jgi:hypothetical protein
MRKLLWAFSGVIVGLQLPVLAKDVNTVASGTQIAVRTDESIHVRDYDRGRIYSGQLARDVYASDGRLAFPRGTPVELIVREVGNHEMALDLESIILNGRRFVVDANGTEYDTHGRPGVGENRRTAKYVGGGAVIGSIIGAIAGGGKGAAIGAAAGAASGAGAQMITRGREIRIPAESLLTFRLEQPLRYADGPDSGYERNGRHYHEYR